MCTVPGTRAWILFIFCLFVDTYSISLKHVSASCFCVQAMIHWRSLHPPQVNLCRMGCVRVYFLQPLCRDNHIRPSTRSLGDDIITWSIIIGWFHFQLSSYSLYFKYEEVIFELVIVEGQIFKKCNIDSKYNTRIKPNLGIPPPPIFYIPGTSYICIYTYRLGWRRLATTL